MRRHALSLVALISLAGCPAHAPVTKAPVGDAPSFAGIEPYLAGPTLVRAEAKARVDMPRTEISGEATLTIRDDGVAEFPMLFDAYVAGRGGFIIGELTQDGVPCAYSVYGDTQKVVTVRVPHPGKTVKLHMTWSGTPTSAAGEGYLLREEALLLDTEGWLPFLVSTDAAWTLDLEWSAGFEGILENAAAPHPTTNGFVGTRSTFHSYAASTVFLQPSFAMRRFTMDGTPVVVAVPPLAKESLPDLEARVRQAWSGLKAIGPLPPGELRIVSSTMTASLLAALGGRSFVAFRGTTPDVSLLAHEMAHSWFGGVIFAAEVQDTLNGTKAARTELWPESLAEYSSTWASSDAEIARTRFGWLKSYAGGLGEGVYLGRTAASYTRAPLLLAGIEHRVGRAKMQKALASFRTRHLGKRASWADIIAVIRENAGATEADELEAWVNHPGSPDLLLVDAKVEDGVLTGAITQSANPPYPGTLELGFYPQSKEDVRLDRDRITTVPVRFSGESTPVKIKVPDGAKTVVLDPDVYLPRAIRVQSNDAFFVSLDGTGPTSGHPWNLTPP